VRTTLGTGVKRVVDITVLVGGKVGQVAANVAGLG
jgi:hypothetical protein